MRLAEHRSHELIPLCHAGALLWHVVPTIVVLGTHILLRVVLKPVADLFRDTGVSGQRLERPPQIAVGRIRESPRGHAGARRNCRGWHG